MNSLFLSFIYVSETDSVYMPFQPFTLRSFRDMYTNVPISYLMKHEGLNYFGNQIITTAFCSSAGWSSSHMRIWIFSAFLNVISLNFGQMSFGQVTSTKRSFEILNGDGGCQTRNNLIVKYCLYSSHSSLLQTPVGLLHPSSETTSQIRNKFVR